MTDVELQAIKDRLTAVEVEVRAIIDLDDEAELDDRLTAVATEIASINAAIEVSAEQPPAAGGGDEYPAMTGRKITVNTPDQFKQAYAAWNPGDHIVLADGFSGALGALNKAPTDADVVIRAQTNQKATVTSVTISGKRHWLWGVKGTTFGLSGDRNVMRRCKWSGNKSGYICKITGSFNRWEYCEFSNSEGGLRQQNGTRGGVWKWCLFKGINGQANASEALILNEGYKQANFDGGFLVEDCLFEACNIGGDENETISSKCSGNTFRRLTFRNTRDLSLRFGNNGEVEAVRIDRGKVRARGRNHKLEGVVGIIECPGGTEDISKFPPSIEALVRGGSGPVEVGGGGKGARAQGIRIEATRQGEVKNLQGPPQAWTIEQASSNKAMPAPNYSVADVGVMARI